MLKNILFVLSVLAVASAQIPSFRWCPEYVPMADFDMGRFLGVWYEAEKYFQFLDPVSRCVMTNYTQGPDGKYHVSNQVTNRFTGIKRVVDGEIKTSKTKNQEGQLHVKYTNVPLIPETQYVVLETDYKSYAVLWSCSGLGPFSAQSAWVMTRARIPEGTILQQAYGVLDKYKISRTFFVKTNQEDCAWFDEAPATMAKPSESISTEAPIVEESVADETKEKPTKIADMRSISVPEVRSNADEKIIAELTLASERSTQGASDDLENVQMEKTPEKPARVPPTTVPDVILNAANHARETVKDMTDEVKKFDPVETIKETFEKPAEKIQEALAAPIEQIQGALAGPIGQIQGALAAPIGQIQGALAAPIGQIQGALAAPIAQIQETFEKPIENIRETIQQTHANIKETLQKPIDKIKEVLTVPSSVNKEKVVDDQAEKLTEDFAEKTKEKIDETKTETSQAILPSESEVSKSEEKKSV